jgi:hypothetical protein
VVGCGRSGTTLLRAQLDAHPDLAVPAEAPFVVALAPRRPDAPFDVDAYVARLAGEERFRLWELPPASLTAALRAAEPRSYAEAVRATYAAHATARGKPRYGDKTPGNVLHLPRLTALLPESVVVHLVRDGRDVAASFLRLGWADTVEEAAQHWRLRVRRGRAAGRRLGRRRYVEVAYESLVRDPESELRRICAAVDLAYDPGMLDHVPHASTVVRTTSHPGYHDRLALPVAPAERGWRERLTPEQVARFELVADGLLDELGYARAGGRPSPATRAAVVAARARWAAHRVRRRLGR